MNIGHHTRDRGTCGLSRSYRISIAIAAAIMLASVPSAASAAWTDRPWVPAPVAAAERSIEAALSSAMSIFSSLFGAGIGLIEPVPMPKAAARATAAPLVASASSAIQQLYGEPPSMVPAAAAVMPTAAGHDPTSGRATEPADPAIAQRIAALESSYAAMSLRNQLQMTSFAVHTGDSVSQTAVAVSSGFNALNVSGVNAGTLAVAHGGTNASSQTTYGVAYFDGSSLTTGAGLTFDGAHLGIGASAPAVSLDVGGTDAIALPAGTDAERPASPASGYLRYNTTSGRFEGYSGSSWSGLGGVMDANQDTYISAESIPGANEDSLFFIAAGAERARLTDAGAFGIGTTSPAATLAVAGGAYIAGPLVATGTVSVLANYMTSIGTNGVDLNGGYVYSSDTTNSYQPSTGTLKNYGGTLLLQDSHYGNTLALDSSARKFTTNDAGASVTYTAWDGAAGSAGGDTIVRGGDSQTVNGSAAGSLYLRPGNHNGTNGTPGSIIFQSYGATSTPGAFERMRLSPAGNLGIGTTSPWAALSVVGQANGQAPLFAVGSSTVSATSTALIVTNTGFVGAGTTNPGVKFTAAGPNGAPTTSGRSQDNASLRVGNQANDYSLDFGVNGGVPWIQAVNKNNLSEAVNLNIAPNGTNVGIGTASAARHFVVSGREDNFTVGTGSKAAILINQEANGGLGRFSELLFSVAGEVGSAISSQYSAFNVGSGHQESLVFSTKNSLAGVTEKMRISHDGMVGIGTTSPAKLLSVAGDIYVGGSGTSTIENNLEVLGTLHGKMTYTGDLFFKNGFSFAEAPDDAVPQALILRNQRGETVMTFDEHGDLSATFSSSTLAAAVTATGASLTASPSFMGALVAGVSDWMSSLGFRLAAGIAYMKAAVADAITAKALTVASDDASATGISIADRATGSFVCVYIESGMVRTSAGQCGAAQAAVPASAAMPLAAPVSIVPIQATSSPEESTTTATDAAAAAAATAPQDDAAALAPAPVTVPDAEPAADPVPADAQPAPEQPAPEQAAPSAETQAAQ